MKCYTLPKGSISCTDTSSMRKLSTKTWSLLWNSCWYAQTGPRQNLYGRHLLGCNNNCKCSWYSLYTYNNHIFIFFHQTRHQYCLYIHSPLRIIRINMTISFKVMNLNELWMLDCKTGTWNDRSHARYLTLFSKLLSISFSISSPSKCNGHDANDFVNKNQWIYDTYKAKYIYIYYYKKMLIAFVNSQ